MGGSRSALDSTRDRSLGTCEVAAVDLADDLVADEDDEGGVDTYGGGVVVVVILEVNLSMSSASISDVGSETSVELETGYSMDCAKYFAT